MISLGGRFQNSVGRNDLRLRLRGWRWAAVTTFYVGVLAIIAVAFLVQQYDPASNESSRVGIQLFQVLSLFQLFLIVFVTPASLAGAISGERHDRTWELLLVTRLSPRQIVWGKLSAGLIFNAMLMAASLPLFCLVFLFGGVGFSDLVHVYVVFLVTALLFGAASLALSALTGRLTVSYMLALFLALALTVGLSLFTLNVQAESRPTIANLGNTAFQSVDVSTPLTPLAQLDPLVALLSALPDVTGGTLLGSLGTVDHAFRLPWKLPLWGAYAFLAVVVSALFFMLTVSIVGTSARVRLVGVKR